MREEQGTPGLDACAETEARRLLAAAFETAPVRPGLAAGLVAAASPHGPGSPAGDAAGQVRKRAARERRRRILVPAGAIALAAAVAGGVTAGAATGGGAARTPDALQAVTAALVKTSAQSFTFRDTIMFPQAPSVRVAGKFDPVTGTGAEVRTVPPSGSRTGSRSRILIIGGHMYIHLPALAATHHGKPWVEGLPLNPVNRSQPIAGPLQIAIGIDVNPATVLALLQSATTVHEEGPASGPGWTGTRYSFKVNTSGKHTHGFSSSVGGTVSVDSSGRVRQIVSVLQNDAPNGTFKITGTQTFGGFGTPVSVTAPPASQVDNLGNASIAVPLF